MLWSAILDSSVWDTPPETRLTWITMLLLKDAEGFVRGTVETIRRRANLPAERVLEAVQTLSEPDASSHTPDEEGRRIRAVPGGWFVINHEQYRFSTEARREFWREQKRKQREKEEAKKKPRKSAGQVRAESDGRERRFVEAERNGNEELAGLIAAEGLPEAPVVVTSAPPEEDLPGPEYQGSDEEPLA